MFHNEVGVFLNLYLKYSCSVDHKNIVMPKLKFLDKMVTFYQLNIQWCEYGAYLTFKNKKGSKKKKS